MSSTSVPTTMRAWQYSTASGGIEKNLVLNPSAPVPTISSRLGDSELLIRVLAASLNPADYKTAELGAISHFVVRHPATPGMDFCGRVVQTTRTVDDFAIGDLVFGRIDLTQHGTLAEYIVAPTKACAHVPDGVSVEEAAAVGVAGLTEYQAMAPNVKPGDKIFINGGSGGTGTFGVQIAKALGCHVTTTCSPGKIDLCRSLGADEIINYTATDVAETLRAKGQVFSLVVDNVGTPANLYKAADDFLLPQGRFVQVGAPLSLSTATSIASRFLVPSFLGGGKRHFQMFVLQNNPEHLKQLGKWIAEKKIRVVIDQVYDMEHVPKAFEVLKQGKSAGKLVVPQTQNVADRLKTPDLRCRSLEASACFLSETLRKLCTEDQLALLDAIDKLRLQGLSNYVSLPQIIVCGDQSNLCTRFPTELVLRRAPHFSAHASIIPHESRTESEQLALRNFREELSGFDALPDLIESAKLAMGITPHRAFAPDILRVEITGPDRPHLTIVDLPGLIHSETKNQTRSDVDLVQNLVRSYMKESRCIILAVVSAKNDFANQVILKLAREADEDGNRTLGVITKPDTLVPGGDSEAMYISLAKNQQVAFRHGWHVVKNMDSEKGTWTHAERDAEEAMFFSTGSWASLPSSSLGIEELRYRLSRVLLGQIAAELPSLMAEMENIAKTSRARLDELGDPRATQREQRAYLLQVSHTFQRLVTTSRLRAIIQNVNEVFANEMRTKGHYREIVAKPPEKGAKKSKSGTPIPITRNDFIAHIEQLMHRNRGCELPGTFSPLFVRELFREQSQPWESIVRQHVEKVWNAARNFIEIVVKFAADDTTAKSLKLEVIDPAMKRIWESMGNKVLELLYPRENGHPITYDQDFVQTLEELRRERRHQEVEQILCEYFRVSKLDKYLFEDTYDLAALAQNLVSSAEPDVKRAAADDLLDCLNAYYKVALKRFVDDVAVEVIEGQLATVLRDILSPTSVFKMPSNQVARIAGETEEIRTEREQLERQLDVLSNGLETCKRFAGLRLSGDSVLVPAESKTTRTPSSHHETDSEADKETDSEADEV
ncbi:hypothetical protein VTJ49DRAFT_5248 [Mycothermus thermophilus]|uniref:GED domain-containing protein n=1 Tax=Humicola insolens TaxID=85995 RepID=A0ABR3V4M2_HUMIN